MVYQKYRIGTKEDLPFLKEMLYEAAIWNQAEDRPAPEDLLSHPELKKILDNWGDKKGDFSIIALDEDEKPVGAVWYRFWTEADHSYGFVEETAPELGIAIKRDFRGRGIGTFLMTTLFQHAKERGVRKISLSVMPENFALKLYQKLGFYKVEIHDNDWIMLIDLE